MRMPPDQLAVDSLDRIGYVKMPGFFRHLRKEDHLEQQVAEFVRQAVPIARVDRVHDLIGLFEQVGLDGVEGLFAIPGAAVRGAQAGHDFDQPREAGRGGRLIG